MAHKIFNCVIVGITSPLSSSNTLSPLSLPLSLSPPSLYHSPSVISFRLCNMRNVFGYGDSQRPGSPTGLSQFPCNLEADVYLRDEGGHSRSQTQRWRRRRGRKCQQKSYKFVIYTWLRFLPAVRCLLPAHVFRSAICSLDFKQKP